MKNIRKPDILFLNRYTNKWVELIHWKTSCAYGKSTYMLWFLLVTFEYFIQEAHATGIRSQSISL